MNIYSEDQILDPVFRKQVLKEIEDTENQARKAEYLKRYECYKDQTNKYVTQGLVAEGLKPETIAQMSNRGGNISICRKVVNKLARTYSGGVQRLADPEIAQEAVDDLSRLLSFDQRMKKGDRYRELQRNSMLMIAPELDSHESTPEVPRFKLKFSVLAPWQYDVLEDCHDREVPKVVIISNYNDGTYAASASETKAGVHGDTAQFKAYTNKRDDLIADAPQDAGLGSPKEYIWWSQTYHFTTNEKGEVISGKSPEDLYNPIGLLPLANNADEQDGQFWARGGNDLIEGSILINKLITDMNFIAYLQGYGQIVITGQNVTKMRFQVGPNNALMMEYDPSKEEPKPEVDIISAQPPIEAWMKMVEQYVALLLTTNNLAPSNVSGTLSANTFPSGIAMLVEQSEATDDISDKQAEYKVIERHLWEVVKRWQNLYYTAGLLSEEFAEVGPLPEDLDISLKFHESKAVVTEADKLANLEKRKDLGINEMVELIMIDNPDMTREEAEEKLKRIQGEKLKAFDRTVYSAFPGSGGEETAPAEPVYGEEDAD